MNKLNYNKQKYTKKSNKHNIRKIKMRNCYEHNFSNRWKWGNQNVLISFKLPQQISKMRQIHI